MHSILNAEILLPIALLLLQAFVLLFITILVLKRVKVLKTPYAGMEYSQIIIASIFLFGVFFIATASTGGLFQAFKTFQNGRIQIVSNTFSKFSQFFLVVLFYELVFALASFSLLRLILGMNKPLKEVEEGNIPASILTGVGVLCFAMILQLLLLG